MELRFENNCPGAKGELHPTTRGKEISLSTTLDPPHLFLLLQRWVGSVAGLTVDFPFLSVTSY